MKRQARNKRSTARASRPAGPRTFEVSIERIVPGGIGLGHVEGMTALIPLTAPGDRVKFEVERVRGNTVFGTMLEILSPGSSRQEPPCPHFGICGGCDFQQLTYTAQVQAKEDMIVDCLRRIGGIEWSEIVVTPSPKPLGYRTRAEWVIDPGPPSMGYRARGSKRIVDITACPILDEPLETTRARLRDRVQEDGVDHGMEIHAASAGQTVALSPDVEGDSAKLLISEIGGERYGYDATCFFQANTAILPEFVDYVISQATDGQRWIDGEAVDLYSGVGLFTIPLARRFRQVTGVETHARAGSYAHENAKAAGLTNVSISGLPADQWLRRKGNREKALDLLVLDPPRTGADNDVIEQIVLLRPSRIVYVSCDPATLARDAKRLLSVNYAMTAIRGFDMFPQTHHVESVATFVAGPAPASTHDVAAED